jgi:Fe-Mn family superoxide dismutase
LYDLVGCHIRIFKMMRKFSTFRLPKLPFPANSLEPEYDARTLDFHHGKHHLAYVTQLNNSFQNEKLSLLDVIQNKARDHKGARNFGGGHYNHCLYWLNLGKTGVDKPRGKLLQDIEREFGSFDKFKVQFSQASSGQFGSGWGWLSLNNQGRLVISSTLNQDNPLMTGVVSETALPFLTCDVWEHAYYLQYQNRRPEYIEKFWSIVNWPKVEQLYEEFILNHKPVPVDEIMDY